MERKVKMNKKLILLTSVAILALSMASESRAATTLPDNGTCGNGCKYEVTTVNGERILTVSNDSNYDSSQPLSIKESAFDSYEYTNVNFDKINITGNFESIGDYAFYENHAKSANISEGVKSIGTAAFSGNNLKTVTLPESLTSIGAQAFYENNLTSIKLPENLTNVGAHAFRYNQLTSVEIPDNVTSIGSNSFAQQGYIDENNKWIQTLTDVKLGDSVEIIERMAFLGNPIAELVIPDSVTSIGQGAFASGALTSLVIPDSVSLDGDYAFIFENSDAEIICQGSVEKCHQLLDNNKQAGVFRSYNYNKDTGRLSAVPYYANKTFSNISMARDSQCDGKNYYYTGSECVREPVVANRVCNYDHTGYIKRGNYCASPEVTYAKKRYTPAEANEWLRDSNDNYVVLTFRK